MAILFAFLFAFGLLIGYIWGNSRKGLLVKYTNELPNGFMRVVSTDKVSTVLEQVSVGRKRFLVSTEVFGGKPIRPKEIVRKIKSERERKSLDIPVLGYPPLIKDMI